MKPRPAPDGRSRSPGGSEDDSAGPTASTLASASGRAAAPQWPTPHTAQLRRLRGTHSASPKRVPTAALCWTLPEVERASDAHLAQVRFRGVLSRAARGIERLKVRFELLRVTFYLSNSCRSQQLACAHWLPLPRTIFKLSGSGLSFRKPRRRAASCVRWRRAAS